MKTTYDFALEHADEGYNVIPLWEKSKRPKVKWKIYQEQRVTRDELKKWFRDEPQNNIAIVTGKISNVDVVDCDNQDAIDWYYMNTVPSERIVDTSRGLHFYHRYKTFGCLQRNGVDVRGDGGLTTAVGSIHPTGTDYIYDSKGEMTDFNPEWFMTVKEQIRSKIHTGLNYDIAVVACKHYLDTMDAAISGKGGHKQTFKAACRIRDFVSSFMTPEQAMPLIRYYNEKCDPPWSEKELIHKLESAWKHGK